MALSGSFFMFMKEFTGEDENESESAVMGFCRYLPLHGTDTMIASRKKIFPARFFWQLKILKRQHTALHLAQ